MLTYLLGDVLRLYAGDVTPGEIGGVKLTQGLALAIANLLVIPIHARAVAGGRQSAQPLGEHRGGDRALRLQRDRAAGLPRFVRQVPHCHRAGLEGPDGVVRLDLELVTERGADCSKIGRPRAGLPIR